MRGAWWASPGARGGTSKERAHDGATAAADRRAWAHSWDRAGAPGTRSGHTRTRVCTLLWSAVGETWGWESPWRHQTGMAVPSSPATSAPPAPSAAWPTGQSFPPTGRRLPLRIDWNCPGRIFAISDLTLPLCFKVRKVRCKFNSCFK